MIRFSKIAKLTRTTAAITLTAALGTGCMSGTGGDMAHRQWPDQSPMSWNSKGTDDAIQRWHLLRVETETLALAGADQCMPGQLERQRNEVNTIGREIAGGLLRDAGNRLVTTFRDGVTLRARLKWLRENTDCAGPTPVPEFPIACNTAPLFDTDSAALRDEDVTTIAACADALEQMEMPVAVIGHTDHRGSDAHNDDLGLRRAAGVADALMQGGVEPGLIYVSSAGESVAGAPTGDLQADRRAQLLPKGGADGDAREPIIVADWRQLVDFDEANGSIP